MSFAFQTLRNYAKRMIKTPLSFKSRMMSDQTTRLTSKSKKLLKNEFIFSSTLCIGSISATYLYILHKEYMNGPEFIKNKYQKYINDPSFVYKSCEYIKKE